MPYPRHCEPKAKQSRASARKPGALALGCFVAPLLATTERGEHKSFTGLDVNPYTSRITYSPSTVTGQLPPQKGPLTRSLPASTATGTFFTNSEERRDGKEGGS